MDAVITYVNGMDPYWQEDYRQFVDETVNAKRFRDWGTLKYLLRGICTYMPFIENVFLVVARESQIPDWADTSALKIALHKDFIPERYLPVFNSNPIELFMHRIPGLDERFIYFNDDFFPLNICKEEDFFKDGKAVMSLSRQLLTFGMYRKICANSYRVARKAAGLSPTMSYERPQHTCAPMFKSLSEFVFSKVQDDLEPTAESRVRNSDNVCQYVYTDYQKIAGQTIDIRFSNRHFSLAASSISEICRFIENPDRKMACINDVNFPDSQFLEMKSRLLRSFEKRLPDKSRFEL